MTGGSVQCQDVLKNTCPWYPLGRTHKVADKNKLDWVIERSVTILQDKQFKSEEVYFLAPGIKYKEECSIKRLRCMKMIHIFDLTSQ